MAITAALFDFGGVILSSPFDAFADYERANGLPEDFIRGLKSTYAQARRERGTDQAAAPAMRGGRRRATFSDLSSALCADRRSMGSKASRKAREKSASRRSSSGGS